MNDKPQQRPQQPTPRDCPHEAFHAQVQIQRLLDACKFVAKIEIHCTQCGEPFRFCCPETGVQWDRPTTGLLGTMLFALIEPELEHRMKTNVRIEMPTIPTRH